MILNPLILQMDCDLNDHINYKHHNEYSFHPQNSTRTYAAIGLA